ncbi:MAG: ketoacyl-ACP synthase III [Lachnospiraceae bacterium]|nr:ketoacyl-ACP synthase III [Lachnospiraceae bacterium]
MKGIEIISTGAGIPSKVMTNDDFAKIVDTNDEWIFTRTGIHERRFCEGDENNLSLAMSAAKQAFERSGIGAEEVGCVVVATVTPTYASPSTACLIQKELALPEDIPVLDINAACAGFIYGLEVARGLLSASDKSYGIVIGVEQLSKVIDMTDRSTCVLFGDGAGAVVIRADRDLLYERYLGVKGGLEIYIEGVASKSSTVHMDGREVFKFAVATIPKVMNSIFEKSGRTMEDVDHCICHQANARIIDHVIKKYKAPVEKFYKNMDHFGNTSAASVPIAMNEMWEKGMLKNNEMLMLVGFGGGLTMAGALLYFRGKENAN